MITTLLLGTMATMFGFDVRSVEELPDVSAKLWRMEYAKNGAELVWVDCADENRTFVIVFRTIPEDDSGVAHILEHAVLCGSEKFPSREPFVEMLKSSPHTYMNAYTAKDSTGYPVASRNEKDFLNLTEVYLDAVFHPNTVKSDWSMRQEGWHYEYDGKTLMRNGIVYSEMKGAMASPHTVMYHDSLRLLFPDSVYRHNSGGLPAKIPSLTFDQYKAFHAKFYHPSNARIFLYGKIDTAKTLPLIASALEPFERRADTVAIPFQKPVRVEETHAYANSEEKDRTLLCDGWVVGRFDDYEKLMGLNVLCEYLTGNNFSPLKAPFLKLGLCEDVGMGVITDQQLTLLANFQNVKDGLADVCRALFRTTLEGLVANGLDTKRLSQLLNKHEFEWRERDTSDRGMNVYHAVIDSWLYGGDPAQNLRATEVFASLRQRLGTGWYERLLKESILENNHACVLTLTPSKTLAAEEEAANAAELKKIQATMSAEQLAAIADAAADLKRRHAAPEDPAILAKLPKLTLADMPVDCEIVGRTVTTNGGITVIRPQMDLKGFFYLDLSFSLAGLSREELLDTTLLTDLFGELGSDTRSAEVLKGEMDGTFGSFTVDVESYEKGPQLVVRLAALDSHRAAALDLAEEVLLRTSFADTAAIETQRQQNRVWMEESTRGRKALEFAGRRAARGLSAAEDLAELFKGLDQIRHLQTAKVGDLAALAKKIFRRENLTVAVAGDVPDAFIADVAARFPNTVPPAVLGRGVDKRDSDRGLGDAAGETHRGTMRSEAFAIDGNIAFAALAAKLPADVAYSGTQQVAGKIISLEHLWPELRVKGGAYGAFFSLGANRTLMFRSYRDPNPARAYAEYAKAGERLAAFVNSGASFEKYQVSTLEMTDPNFSPREKMAYVRSQYFNGRDPELPRQMRREILKTTKADLLAFAETLKRVVPTASRCALGGKDLLAPCGFDTTENILTSTP